MKRTSVYFLIAAALVSASLSSCNDGEDYYLADFYPNALVTVKTNDAGRVFLQLDDQTTLLPSNMTTSPFGGKEVRALTNFRYRPEKSGDYDKVVQINWIDSIRTKGTVPISLKSDNDALYGSAPVEVVDDWITLVEDGYLTLHLRMAWSNPRIQHHINLLTGGNPDNPYEVELRHDAKGDGDANVSDAYVAFRLDGLPGTGDETVKLRLTWKSPRGNRSAEFDYRTRRPEVELF